MSKGSARIPLDTNGKSNGQPPGFPFKVQIALNTNIDVFVFSVPISFSVLLVPTNPCSQAEFNELMARPSQVNAKESFPTSLTEEQIKQKMINNNVSFVFSQANPAANFSKPC